MSTPTSCRTTTSGSCSSSPSRATFSLIGTTDVPYEGDPAAAAITPDETDYLCRVVNRYFKREIAAGRRGLVLCRRAAALRRRQRQRLGGDPRLCVRPRRRRRPGAAAVDLRRQDHDLPQARRARAGEAAAGDGLHARRLDRRRRPARRRHAGCRLRALPGRGARASIRGCRRRSLRRWARAYGTRLAAIAGRRQPSLDDLGPRSRRRPLRGRGRAISSTHEWARTADDVLWRRSRLGLHVGRGHGGAARGAARRGAQRRHGARRRTDDPAPGAGRAASSATRSGSTRCRSICAAASSTCCSGRRWPARPR